MSRLLVNAGNTRVVVVRQDECRADAPLLPIFDHKTPGSPQAAVELARQLADRRGPGEEVVAASVIPQVSEALIFAVPDTQLVDHTWDLPFAVTIRQVHTVGADRWCNVAAATAAGLAHALVVDAGTATTIDVLSGGVFVGGLIAPGMAFAAQALQETAPRLWPVPFAPCELRAGADTAEALQIGAFHVGVHGVAGVVDALWRQQQPHPTVVLTGGLGQYLQRDGWRHDPDWTLRGLAVLADRRRTA